MLATQIVEHVLGAHSEAREMRERIAEFGLENACLNRSVPIPQKEPKPSVGGLANAVATSTTNTGGKDGGQPATGGPGTAGGEQTGTDTTGAGGGGGVGTTGGSDKGVGSGGSVSVTTTVGKGDNGGAAKEGKTNWWKYAGAGAAGLAAPGLVWLGSLLGGDKETYPPPQQPQSEQSALQYLEDHGYHLPSGFGQ